MVLALLSGFALPAHAAANTVITLTFDDGNADQLTAATTLKNLGLHGTYFVPSGWVDQPSYFTSANLQQLYADGNEIAGHTVTHPDLVTLTSDEVTRQVCNGRVALANMGFKVTSFAYPFASLDPAVQTIVKNCGFNSARGLGDLYSKDDPGLPAAETIPPANPYDTAAPEEVDSTWTLSNLENSVTRAQAAGGGWVQLTFHHIAVGTDPTLTISPSLFNQFASWLAQQQTAGSVVVKTVDQVIGGAVQPLVSGPPVPPPPPQGTNMIQNPSLETLTSGIPLCWAAGGYGTNTPSFSVVSPGHTGNNAELLTMSGYVSGDAKLLPALDLGGCSPTGTPGHIYQLSTWYKSNVITQFELYYRTGTGYWTYWTASPLFNSSSNWTQITWTTPALPAGASGISYGLNIQSNGSITTDDYSMIDVTQAARHGACRSHRGDRDGGKRVRGGVVDGPGKRRLPDHLLYGDAFHRWHGFGSGDGLRESALDDGDRHRTHQRHRVHVHRDGDERRRDIRAVGRLTARDSHGANSSGRTHRGGRDGGERFGGGVVDGAGKRRLPDHLLYGDAFHRWHRPGSGDGLR